MLTSEEVKDFLREKCGAEAAGIAPATPFSKEDKQRVIRSREILEDANPEMSKMGGVYDPEDFVRNAKSVIVFGRNSYFGSEQYVNGEGNQELRGGVGNFYMNMNILNKALEQSVQVQAFLESHGYKAVSPFQGFPQKIKAVESGIGFRGKNTLVINEKLGSWVSVSTIITDAPLEPDTPLKKDCGSCTKCIDACPMGAFSKDYNLNIDKCILYYLNHLKRDIPREAREKIGVRIGTCLVCSDVCPYNKNLKVNEADMLSDDIIYPKLLPLMNITKDEYDAAYGSNIFGLIISGRRYLRRNVALALGNAGNDEALPYLETAAKDEDPMVRSHAVWAIGKIGGAKAKDFLGKIASAENDSNVRQEFEALSF